MTEQEGVEQISIEQLQRLVRLLDNSDVSEIEIKRTVPNARLVLRKAKAPESGEAGAYQVIASALEGMEEEATGEVAEVKHTIIAPLVGIFHPWTKPRGKSAVAVGDWVKMGQIVGTIQSLNVLNEVEATVAGRVVELQVQDGQPVEYGQPLMVIDGSTEEE